MAELKPTIERVNGFQVAGVHCGLKKEGKLDFALIVSDTLCTAAGVFTTNQVKAAPVLVDMERLKNHAQRIRAVAINTGCANACTGQQGIDNALQTARWVAEVLGCDENQVLVLSTGVIGTQLPMDKIKHGIELAVDSLGENHWEVAARAIMTTDTRPKMASVQTQDYQIAGIAKGAGMIAPNMATMLGVVVTDAALSTELAQSALRLASESTFNHIVVDGDMSTNDTVFLLANGQGAGDDIFQAGLLAVERKLAQDIVRDGEGASKFITISIKGAPDNHAARQIANTIATSALVKTAFCGNDANWGRIIAAAGRSGVALKPECLKLWLIPGEAITPEKGILLFENGMPTQYREDQAMAVIRHDSVTVVLDCGLGEGEATIWTCDLSHDYVSINGSYRS